MVVGLLQTQMIGYDMIMTSVGPIQILCCNVCVILLAQVVSTVTNIRGVMEFRRYSVHSITLTAASRAPSTRDNRPTLASFTNKKMD